MSIKPLTLNLSKMKKIAGDAHSSTFLHPSGHHMVIAHHGVSALQRKQLERMQAEKFAEGGSVDDPEEKKTIGQIIGFPGSDPAPKPKKTKGQQPSQPSGYAEGGDIHGNPEATPDNPYGTDTPPSQDAHPGPEPIPAQTPDALPPNPEEQTAVAQAPVAPAIVAPKSAESGSAPKSFQDSYEQGQQAIADQEKINAAESKARFNTQKQDILERQKLNKDFQDTQVEFVKHQKQLMSDYMDNHINAKHYLESGTTGEKVARGIALFLGGFSTPFTHGSNPAMDFINKQIDRDIAAQASKQDQEKTILGANQQFFRDQSLAANQTRINMNDIYDHQIQIAATQLGTPQAHANAEAAHAKFAMDNAALLQQNAIRATVMNHLKNGGGGISAVDLANAGMIPMTEASKEQASIEAQKTAIAKTHELYDAMNKEQTAANLLNPQSSRRVAALNSELVNAVMNASASKRLTHESIKAEIEPLEIKTTDNEATRKAKMQGILNIVQRHADPTPYMSQYSPQSLPKYSQEHPNEGKTASDAKGNRIIMQNGRWVPHGK